MMPRPAQARPVFALLTLCSAFVSAAAVAPPATTSTLSAGFRLRSADFPTPMMSRMAEHPVNRDIYAIGMFSPLFRVDVHGSELTPQPVADVRALGLTFNAFASGIDFDADGNVYVCSHNGQILKGHYDANSDDFSTWTLIRNLETEIPVIGEHGFGGIAIDRKAGTLYLNSGSIVSGSDPANPEPDYGINASILSLSLDGTSMTVFARGIRNHFGLAVRDSDGRLFGVENASDCDYAEEFNMVLPDSHQGFPYRSASDRSGSDAGLYPSCDTTAPANLTFTAAWGNLGPDGIPAEGDPGYVDGGVYFGFHPHSTPTGIDFYEPSEMDADANLFPADYHGRAFVTRFGTIRPDNSPAGFDLLTLGLREQDRMFFTNAFLTDLANPLDVVCASSGNVYVLEFPGRLLEISYSAPASTPVSHLARQQKLHVTSEGTGYQVLQYRYSNGHSWVSPFQTESAPVPYYPITGEFIGLFHYDYATGRFSQAIYELSDWLN